MRAKFGKRASIAAGAVLLGIVASASPAFAQNNPAIAQALFQDGRKLMDQKRYDEACPKFAASQKADPAIGTLLNLGDCYEKNGQLVLAWQTFHEAISFAQRVGRKDRQQTATDRASQLEPRLIKLTILARASGIDVKLDGATAAVGTPLPVDPGKHTIEATAKGKKPFTTTVDITDKTKTPSVDIPPLEDDNGPPKEAAAVPPPKDKDPAQKDKLTEPPAEQTKSSWGTQKTIAVVLAGVGVVGVGAGIYYGLLTQSRWNEAQQLCNTNVDPPACSPEGVTLADQAKSAGTIATIAFIGGGLFVAGGAVLFFTAPSAKSTTDGSNVKVGVGPGSLLLRGSF